MKTIRIILSMLLAVMTCNSFAQGIIIYKSNGTQEKLPYVAVDSMVIYYADQDPVPMVEVKAVDLGLPSGTLWADHNVGATAPEAIGGYYAYGETEEKATYSWDSYMCASYSQCGTSSDPLFADGILIINKYLTVVTGIDCNIAGTKYDVATQKWDESWVMPTPTQFKELFNNCTRSTVQINDVWCAEFTGPNGNSVIFPYKGGYKENTNLVDDEFWAYYWTAVLDGMSNKGSEGMCAQFNSSGQSCESYNSQYRYFGMQVRPVKKQ